MKRILVLAWVLLSVAQAVAAFAFAHDFLGWGFFFSGVIAVFALYPFLGTIAGAVAAHFLLGLPWLTGAGLFAGALTLLGLLTFAWKIRAQQAAPVNDGVAALAQ